MGLNYLGHWFEEAVEIPSNVQTVHPDFFVLALMQIRWNIDGTAKWPMQSVDWLVVSLIIELEITPHNGDSRDIPDFQSAYLPIVRDLVSR